MSSRPPARTTIIAPTTRPSDDPEDRPGEAQHPGLDDDRAPDLATGHPRGTQDADLTDTLDDVHGQRVDDPERGDDHGDRGEGIEQPEDPSERVADGAFDLVERHDLEGELLAGRSAA